MTTDAETTTTEVETETNTEVKTETEVKDRSIQKLLALDTFDGLTDGEVHTLIDWYVKEAQANELVNSYRTASQRMVEQQEEILATTLSSSASVLQSIIDSTTCYQNSEPLEVSQLLTSMSEV